MGPCRRHTVVLGWHYPYAQCDKDNTELRHAFLLLPSTSEHLLCPGTRLSSSSDSIHTQSSSMKKVCLALMQVSALKAES